MCPTSNKIWRGPSKQRSASHSLASGCLPACVRSVKWDLSGAAAPHHSCSLFHHCIRRERKKVGGVGVAWRKESGNAGMGWGMARNSSASCLFSGIGGVSLPFSHRTSLALLSFDIDSARWMKFIEEEGSERAIGKRTERKEEGRIEHITHRGRQNVDADGSCPEPLGTIPI